MEFKSLKELYIRIKPALRTRVSELHLLGYKYIKEEDIWNYLKDTKWSFDVSLSLATMVNDILNVDSEDIKTYTLNILKNMKREIK